MRLRVTFSKSGSLRYIGHLDLHTLWERTVRRAGLPLLYTQGFHPTPRIQLACALPLGFIGRCEIVDIWLEDPLEASDDFADKYLSAIQPVAPPGLTLLSAEKVDEHSPALQTQVVSAQYEVSLLDPVTPAEEETLPGKISALMAAVSWPAERRGKPYDLRSLIEDLSLVKANDGQSLEGSRLIMRLAAREGATGRPEAVLEALGIPFESTRVERTLIIFVDRTN